MDQIVYPAAQLLSDTEVPPGFHDGRVYTTIYFGTIPQVLLSLELRTDMRATFNEEEPGVYRRSPYKDSGMWWRTDSKPFPNDTKALHITKDVGCFCEHDCCGCCCGVTYSIYPLASGIVAVVRRTRYNY